MGNGRYAARCVLQKKKARACTSAAELLALAKEEGIELTEDQLKGIAGGDGEGCEEWGGSMWGSLCGSDYYDL